MLEHEKNQRHFSFHRFGERQTKADGRNVPLRGCREPESCYTCRTAGRVGASLCPATSPSRLVGQPGVSQTRAAPLDHRGARKLLTEIHLLVAAGAHVGLAGEGGDAASW